MKVNVIESNGLYLAIISEKDGFPCDSRKEAERIAAIWNESYKRNGCLLRA